MKRYLILAGLVLCGACEKEPTRVGVWAGPTGGNIAKMAEYEINHTGGANGRRLKVRLVSPRAVSNQQITPEGIAASLDSIARDTNVIAVVTRVLDDIAERATVKYEAAGIPYIVLNPVDENYTATHPHAFTLAPSIQEQARFLVDRALSGNAAQRVAVVHLTDRYGSSQAAAIEQELQRRGQAPIYTHGYAQSVDSTYLMGIALELATKKPDIVFWVGRSPSLAVVHGTIKNRLPQVQVFGSDLIESFHVYNNPESIYSGLKFVRWLDPLASDTMMAGLRERQIIWIGRNELINEGVLVYDGLKLIDHVLDQGAATRADVAAKLAALGTSGPAYPGAGGPIAFDANHRSKRGLTLARVTMRGTTEVKDSTEER